MACIERTNVNVNSNAQANDYILTLIKNIDQMQKEANLVRTCEGCDGSLLISRFDTKPITCYLCNGEAFGITIPGTTERTTLFRIEDVRQDSVILRLIGRDVEDETQLECTQFTVVLKLGCICCIQCFEPICCRRCSRCYRVSED